MSDFPRVEWTEANAAQSARWRSEAGVAPPKRVVIIDDTTNADAAFKLACEGTAMLYRGDFQNARLLLQAMARRADRSKKAKPAKSSTEAFHLHRMAQAQRARTLGMLLIPFEAGHLIPLRRAPDVAEACGEAYGPANEAYLASLRELQGLIGAHEWRKKGVEIPALGTRVYPHYGVFSPVRGEYVDLVARVPLPVSNKSLAFDIGTGTGVLAAMLAKRGVDRIVATEQDPRAIDCANENMQRMGFAGRVEVIKADMFPPGKAPLVVCNPPWVPAKPSSPIEHAVYDQDSRMLRSFLTGLAEHLEPKGEGWLILSDLAEHLGLRTREQLTEWIESAGLKVAGRETIRPRHGKASDPDDPLHQARSAEVTTLWRLTHA
ncbi:class I SAM-dependent methyltransferase [Niveibacterium sp. 24ML]|uniref:class I SAM-dependent methyltransferase n=1 Tax=Niveibacterium sp. 24ML TaxID=2985512 RepID=UPI002271F13F|nr:class I SAM-dependent methyltransferase [Niveibacterium sp. 24ML]MCX9154957.1 class I SAM-dependent methyltransferase [Niveibacterium sp. 24ML]